MNSQFPPVSLIHIGLPKTATTYLQTTWANDPNVCLLMRGLMPLIAHAREQGKVRARPLRSLTAPSIGLDTPLKPGQKLVVSNEALSNAYINERADREQVKCFQEFSAALVKAVIPKSKVLIVTRSPAEWIHSIYNQAVKQGGVDTFDQFLQRERDYLEHSLDIRELFITWKQQYGSDNVLLLPIELLRQNEAAFFQEINRFCGIPRSHEIQRSAPINPSLKEGHLDVMRRFNKWVELLVKNGNYRGSLPPEIGQALNVIRFATRYSLESPNPGLERRLRLIEKSMRTQHISRESIPRDLLKAVRSKNAKQLKKDEFFGYREVYT